MSGADHEADSGRRVEEGPVRWVRRSLLFWMYLFLASSYFSIAVNSISLGGMAGSWTILMILEKRWNLRPTGLEWFFLAYVCAEVIATIFSVKPMQSLAHSKRVLLIGIVYFFVTHLSERTLIKRAITVLLGSAAAVAVIGVLKLVLAPPEDVVRLGVFQFYMTTSGEMMIAGLLGFPFVIHRGTPPRVRVALAVCLIPILIVLYATVTRGAYLGFLVGAVAVVLVRNKKLALPFLLVLLLIAIFAPPYISGRIQSIVDLSHPENASRLMMWTAGLRIFADYPVFGVGDIDLGDLMRQYADPGYPGVWGHLHNIPLQFLVTLGSVGFVAVAALFVKVFREEYSGYRMVRDEWFAGSLTLGTLAVLVGVFIHGLTEWTFGDQEVAVLVWTTIGFSIATRRVFGAKADQVIPDGGGMR